MTPGPTATIQSLFLAAVFATIGLAWLVSYALVASATAGWFRRPAVKRALNAVTGVVLVGSAFAWRRSPGR